MSDNCWILSEKTPQLDRAELTRFLDEWSPSLAGTVLHEDPLAPLTSAGRFILEEAGGKVARALCLLDRGEGAADAYATRGLVLESVFTRADLPL